MSLFRGCELWLVNAFCLQITLVHLKRCQLNLLLNQLFRSWAIWSLRYACHSSIIIMGQQRHFNTVCYIIYDWTRAPIFCYLITYHSFLYWYGCNSCYIVFIHMNCTACYMNELKIPLYINLMEIQIAYFIYVDVLSCPRTG